MKMKTSMVGLDAAIGQRLLESIHSKKRVSGYTHEFYRYPARFAPEFVRTVIEAFSNPGDTVLDPFMGGGTTVVEGLSLGRRVVGVDLNGLAIFIARVKSTPLSTSELNYTHQFAQKLLNKPFRIKRIRGVSRTVEYFKNTPWWIRNSTLAILAEIDTVPNKKVYNFLRCALLKTSQWALDCRDVIPTSKEFFGKFCDNIFEMCKCMEDYKTALHTAEVPLNNHFTKYRRIIHRSAIGVDEDKRIPSSWLPAKLVVTSPPYPGVHVLYHRWQVRGRRETPAPFGILGIPDGHGPSYFTFSGRYPHRPGRYFEVLTSAYRSIANLLTQDSLVVQLISFADPNSQLKRFLEAMTIAGFEEYQQKELGLVDEGRIVRSVPGRKWYTHLREDLPAGKELLLLHRLRELR